MKRTSRHPSWSGSGPAGPAAPGFTLIELLVVFSLLALLLTLAVPRYLQSTQSASEKVRAQNLATLRDAIDKFRADQGRFPSDLAELVRKQYLRSLPVDPITGRSDWVALAPSGSVDTGVYDVAPPAAQPASSAHPP